MRPTLAHLLFAILLGLGTLEAETGGYSALEILEELQHTDTALLWPGFNPREIPALVFDGKNTYLVHSREPLAGFAPMDGVAGIYVFEGQHPRVLGNSRAQIDGLWLATSVLRERSPLTGDLYSRKHLAAILIHEMFHVHQKLTFPEWRPDETVLFGYPTDTLERLNLRRLEMKSFLKALNADDPREAMRWSAAALSHRKQRLDLLGPTRARYEDELQRFEGLGNYIECVAAGKPLSSDNRYQDFSPGVIRDLGYLEGTWMAGLLDRLATGWKKKVTENPSLYLADLLSAACAGVSPASFPEDELGEVHRQARLDFDAWEKERTELLQEIQNREGYRITIDSEQAPLYLRMFFATHTEDLRNGSALHRRLFMAGNSAGTLEVGGRDCVVTARGPGAILGVVIPGLVTEPEIVQDGKHVSLKSDGIALDFSTASVSATGKDILIKVEAPVRGPEPR